MTLQKLVRLAVTAGLLASASAVPPAIFAQSAEVHSAIGLYNARKYAAAADAFERIIRTAPSARVLYYAALSNQGAGRVTRAEQLYDYLAKHYPGTGEAASALKALEQMKAGGAGRAGTAGATAAGASSGASVQADATGATGELPQSVIDALPPHMRDILQTEEGRKAVQQALKDNAQHVAAIRKAEAKGGALNKVAAAAAANARAAAMKARAERQYPFTAADIARDGARGIDQSR